MSMLKTNGELYKCSKHGIVNNTGYCHKCAADLQEEINELLGKTNLSFALDSLQRKGKISADTLEHFYDEIHTVINTVAGKEYERGIKEQKEYTEHMKD